MGTIITVNDEDFDLRKIEDSDLLDELKNRIDNISEREVEFIKDHFDWVDNEDPDPEDEQILLEASEILEQFEIESILDQQKLEHLGKVFKKYTLNQLETLLPE